MTAHHIRWSISLDSEFGHADISSLLATFVSESEAQIGMLCVSVVGSTAGITTIEYEPGALRDLRDALDTIAPTDGDYEHNQRWGDGNGFSHLRSALMRTSLTVPIVAGRLQLGTWQQVVVFNFDTRERDREIVAVIVDG